MSIARLGEEKSPFAQITPHIGHVFLWHFGADQPSQHDFRTISTDKQLTPALPQIADLDIFPDNVPIQVPSDRGRLSRRRLQRRAADENLPWDRLPACQGAHLTGWKPIPPVRESPPLAKTRDWGQQNTWTYPTILPLALGMMDTAHRSDLWYYYRQQAPSTHFNMRSCDNPQARPHSLGRLHDESPTCAHGIRFSRMCRVLWLDIRGGLFGDSILATGDRRGRYRA